MSPLFEETELIAVLASQMRYPMVIECLFL